MVNRENFLLVTIWLFLALAVGFGAFMGLALTGSDINFPPAGTAYAETTEALAKAQWLKLLRIRDAALAFRPMADHELAFPAISIPYQTWGVNLKALPNATLNFLKFTLPDGILRFLMIVAGLLGTGVKLLVFVVAVLIVVSPIFLTIGFLTTSPNTRTDHTPRRQRAYVGNVVRID